MIGQTISHYTILEKLGEGGMGVVYKAHDTKLDRDVALKFLPSALTRDSESKERFIHEAKAASSLQHNNICTVHEIDETADGQLFIAMDCYEGETLKKKIQQGPLTIGEVLDYAGQIAFGLLKAHGKGIVHRDIKPANIIITNDGVVKIVDFGLAKLAGLTKITRTGSTVGTAAYMSPEQIRGEEVDHRTDIFSLGVVLFELMTGQLPFRGVHEAALAYEICNMTPEPIHTLREDAPAAFQRIVDRAMDKEVGTRYQSVEDLAADLAALRQALASGQTLPRNLFTFPRLKKRTVVVLATLALAIAGIAVYMFSPLRTSLGRGNVPSIAILYLKNLGPEADEPYTYGITQELIVDIAKAGIVRVAPMKDALSIQHTNLSMEEIAERLRVKYVLEGTFKREAGVFHLAAQVVEVSSGQTLWANKLQAQVDHASILQRQLAEAIINALQLSPTPELMKEITASRTPSPEAYEYYLRATYAYKKKKSRDDLRVAQELFRKAIALDSAFISPRVGLGSTYEVQGEYLKADTIYTMSMDLAQSMGERISEADCCLRLGVVRMNLADYPRAGEYFGRSLSIYRELGDRSGESSSLNNYGALYTMEGDNAKALEYYRNALKIIRSLEGSPDESRLLNNMGTATANQGEYSEAIELFSRCIMLKRQEEDRRGEGIALGNLANVFRDLGDYRGALDHYARSLRIHREVANRPYEASTLLDLGDYFRVQELPDSARACYEQAAALSRDLGEAFYFTMARMMLAKVDLDRGRFQRSCDSLANAIVALRQLGDKQMLAVATGWYLLAKVHLGRHREVEREIASVEILCSELPAGSVALPIVWNLYKTFTLLGDSSKAITCLEKAIREMNTLSGKITDRALRQSYLTNVKDNREIAAAWNRHLADTK